MYTAALVWVFVAGFSIIHCQENYVMNGYANNQFGTNTAYFWRYPPNKNITENGLMYAEYGGKNCSAVHVNVVARHGARYVTLDVMKAFTQLQEKLKPILGNQSYSFINTWTNNYPEDQAGLLTFLGMKEMDYIGYTIGYQLRDLLVKASNGTAFNGGSVKFAATSVKRTQTSARYFQNGLSRGALQRNDTSIPIAIRNDVLRFFDNCSKYEQVTTNDSQVLLFQDGIEIELAIDDIVKKLQLNGTLLEVDMELIWQLCASELAVMNSSDWCTIISDKHRETMEYLNDLTDYYTRLYAYPVTAEMACPLVSDVFSQMDRAIEGHDGNTNYTHGVFQIGHADTLMEFAANLGFFNDNIPFHADNDLQLQNRTFRSSVVDTYSSHFTFILYNCGEAGSQNYASRLLFNGSPLKFPVCNSYMCDYNTVRQAYQQSIDHCDWKNVCDTNQSKQ